MLMPLSRRLCPQIPVFRPKKQVSLDLELMLACMVEELWHVQKSHKFMSSTDFIIIITHHHNINTDIYETMTTIS